MKYIKTCVIGHPIIHSKSPLIHNTWIAQYKLNGEYSAIDIPCESLRDGISKLIDDGFSGFNVTLPHKVALLQLCDNADEIAKNVGAVNTVTIKNGKLFGTNTDVFGFTQNIKENAQKFSFKDGPSLVLGAGGAARAVVQGLINEGVPKIYIANRTTSNADILLKTISNPEIISVIPWEHRSEKKYLQNINLLVNTTSLGMIGKDPLNINLKNLPKTALVNDIVYAPLQTELLTQANAQGNPTVTGIGMLLHQARPAFQSWFGVLPDITPDLAQRVLS